MVDVRPDPKPGSRSEGRTRPRRTFRKKATRKEWAAIRAEKVDGKPCRICTVYRADHHARHLVSRARGGDGVAANIVPLCADPLSNCHKMVTENCRFFLGMLAERLTDDEYAYCVSKLGEGAMERLFGVGASR